MTSTEDTKNETELNYEEMVAELREIAKKLDDPVTSVEDAVRLHARGMELVSRCEAFLEKAELTITEVSVPNPAEQ
ncbi:MAG TPA: exodeoxyribonuclease VII small subunit [Methanocorpusculum sp.]|nr:exodeoxyribonuclease VII small subunit [Methanocorpusculum sp.]